jgi:hypothetical protein
MSKLLLLLLGLSVGGLIALSPDLAIPLVILLLPGLITLLIDSSPGATLSRAMLLFQVAACVNPVSDAWYKCAGIHGCLSYLCEPMTILRAWLAAAVAWLVAQVLPIVLKLLDDHRLENQRSTLVSRRAALVAEWGLENEQR